MPQPAQSAAESPRLWTPQSWRDLPIRQQPDYKNAEALGAVEAQLRTLPPLAAPNEAVR